MNTSSLNTQLRDRWRALAPRERTLVTTAGVVLGLSLLWWVGLAPALRTLGQSDARQRSLDAQWQQMQALEAHPQLRTLHRPANLEDLFLKLTGRQIRQDG